MDDLTQDALKDLSIRFAQSRHSQELRVSAIGGGPWGMEVIVTVDEEFGARLAVWNPFRNEWAQIEMPRATAHGGIHEYASSERE